ncbi:hypothetical protein A1507_07855 [Methylomonas koyamae]|uniref:Uncharacterized protein n=1 Tax=Methylomonas koyamae TaxID=702114 RepID=A0A177NM76_9GAMM|nr:hypothetical protein A1507_07855 [Methylomonas koyamae]
MPVVKLVTPAQGAHRKEIALAFLGAGAQREMLTVEGTLPANRVFPKGGKQLQFAVKAVADIDQPRRIERGGYRVPNLPGSGLAP